MNQTVINTVAPGRQPAEVSLQAWTAVPRLMWQLLRRHWPQLLFWFFAQRVSYDVCMALSVVLSLHSALLGYAGMSLLVLSQLITTAMMFLALKPSLPATTPVAASATLTSAPTVGKHDWMGALSAALLPFFAFYAGWGLLEEIRRGFDLSFSDKELARAIDHLVLKSQPLESLENWRDVMSLHGLWVALLISAVIRYIAKWRAGVTGRLRWILLATACEAYWVFIGAVAITNYVGQLYELGQHTKAWRAVGGWWQNPFLFHISLDGVKEFLAPALRFIGVVANALIMPLIWLAITAIIYGMDLRKQQRIDQADTLLSSLVTQYKNSHFLVKRLVGMVSGGWHSKGVPVLNSIRLVLRAGLPALVVLCVGWQLLAFIDAWGWRLALHVIGPHDMSVWYRIANPVGMLAGSSEALRPSLIIQILRVVLLAATFDRALAHVRSLVSYEYPGRASSGAAEPSGTR